MSISLGNPLATSSPDKLAFFLGDTNNISGNLNIETAFTDVSGWHHVSVVVSNMSTAPTATMYLDGVSVGSDTGTLALTDRSAWDTALQFGAPDANERYFDGGMDEIRLATTTRTSDWIATEFNNQDSPGTYLTFGAEIQANDAPVVTAPGSALSASEQVGLAIHGTGFGVSDADEAGGGATATLTVGEGILTIAAGDSGITIDSGNGSGTVTISGTVAQLNNLLTGGGSGTISYLNGSDTPSASTTITVTVNDQGNTGADPGLSGDASSEEGSNSQTINITAVNDDPTNAGSLPSDITVSEDVSSDVDLSAINLSDVDHGGGNLTVTLTTSTGGNLSASSGGGVSVGGSGSGVLSLTGTLADLNTFLDTASNVQYLHGTPHLNGNDADTIAVQVNDNGNTGTGGGADQALGSVNVDISAVNDAPLNTVPGTQTVAEETTTAIGGISIADVDAASGNLTTRLQVTNGVLEITLSGSATISAGANSSNDLTIQGTVADINATLASLTYTGNTDVVGVAADTLTVTTDDGGNTGSGGALQDVDNIQIDITTVNDAPVVTAPGSALSGQRTGRAGDSWYRFQCQRRRRSGGRSNGHANGRRRDPHDRGRRQRDHDRFGQRQRYGHDQWYDRAVE